MWGTLVGKAEELLIILLIILILFGGRKLPDLARGIGKSVREIRKGFEGEVNDDNRDKTETKGSDKKS